MFRSPVRTPLHDANWSRPTGNLDYRVTSGFGPREIRLGDGTVLRDFHGALDIGNTRLGGDVYASASGIVEAAGNLTYPWSQASQRWPSGNYGGLMVVLKHPRGLYSIYAHLANRSVTTGQTVFAGDRIGAIGDSGSAQGQGHLHFGIQAPAPIPGVGSNPTVFGIGLDVDPWPLITGAIPDTALPPEDDVKLKGRFVNHIHNRRTSTTVDAHFRSGVETGDDQSLKVMDAGTVFFPVVHVKGRSVGGNDDWLGGFLYIGGYQFGYFHTSVLAEGTPIELSGYTAEQMVDAKAEGIKAGFADAKTKAVVAVQGIRP